MAFKAFFIILVVFVSSLASPAVARDGPTINPTMGTAVLQSADVQGLLYTNLFLSFWFSAKFSLYYYFRISCKELHFPLSSVCTAHSCSSWPRGADLCCDTGIPAPTTPTTKLTCRSDTDERRSDKYTSNEFVYRCLMLIEILWYEHVE